MNYDLMEMICDFYSNKTDKRLFNYIVKNTDENVDTNKIREAIKDMKRLVIAKSINN